MVVVMGLCIRVVGIVALRVAFDLIGCSRVIAVSSEEAGWLADRKRWIILTRKGCLRVRRVERQGLVDGELLDLPLWLGVRQVLLL